MSFNLKKFSKTQLSIGIALLSSILGIISFFFFSNGDKIEFNSASEYGDINNQKGNSNIVVNTVATGGNVTIAENIVNNVTENKIPTKIEEEKEKQWDECRMVFDAFIRRLNRSDYLGAYNMLDK